MKTIAKKIIFAMMIGASATTALAQSAIDAYNILPGQTRGTARFMAMGGAFTSLGGDLSTLAQNPAGMGVYRKSEIGATLDVDFRNFSTTPDGSGTGYSNNLTKAYCNNFGYIGAARLSGGMVKFIQWGATYNRIGSFDRTFTGYNNPTATSLTNYIASYTNGVPSNALELTDKFNPYSQTLNPGDTPADWLSVLAYNSWMINANPDGNTYNGLFQNGKTNEDGEVVVKPTHGDALYSVRERGYVDEYNLAMSMNVDDFVYLGLGVGIYDLSFQREEEYSESMADALISTKTDNGVIGNAGFTLNNVQHISASGANLKIGVIVKPIDQLRIGAAIHTPTWLSCTTTAKATTTYSMYNPNRPTSDTNPFTGDDYTDVANYGWRLNTPWRFMFGVSTVLGGKAIISADYEHVQYPAMTTKYQKWTGYSSSYVEDSHVKSDIKNYFRGANTLRLGAEYRITPQFSVRAGYNFTTSNTTQMASEGKVTVYTSGTLPSYRLDGTAHAASIGLGYRYKFWTIDAAYVYNRLNSEFKAYTDFDGHKAPGCKLVQTFNSLVISTSFKF